MKRDADSSFSVELRSKCTEAGVGAASVCWGTSGDAEYEEPHPRHISWELGGVAKSC